MKLFFGVMALACVPVALAGNNVPYPKENVTQFVVEKLDVTTLPSTIRPKLEKRKKTFGEYGYVTRQLDEKGALVETTPRGSQISMKKTRVAADPGRGVVGSTTTAASMRFVRKRIRESIWPNRRLP